LNSITRLVLFQFGIAVIVGLASAAVSAQFRDYFTDDEVEMVREAQFIDRRMDVLIHCIDRRWAVLKVAGAPVVSEKDKDNWGPMPTGTHTELLGDIKQILQKAIDDIDNLAERPDSAPLPLDPKEKPKKKDDLFPKAVRKLAAAAERYKPLLQKELDVTKEKREVGILQDAVEMCDEITASVTKLKS
jgi:hypothetical protein